MFKRYLLNSYGTIIAQSILSQLSIQKPEHYRIELVCTFQLKKMAATVKID
jgi:hypothetical protein